MPSVTDHPFSMNIATLWHQGDQSYCEGFKPGTAWNEYVVEWTPHHVSWTVNGKLCRKNTDTKDVKLLREGQSIIMDFWTPTKPLWGGGFNDKGMPWYARYDYVKVEKWNEKTGQFEFHWRDDFDSFDETRWKA